MKDKKNIALAMIDIGFIKLGATMDLEILSKKKSAIIVEKLFYYPKKNSYNRAIKV